jgi:hypothetical protein
MLRANIYTKLISGWVSFTPGFFIAILDIDMISAVLSKLRRHGPPEMKSL